MRAFVAICVFVFYHNMAFAFTYDAKVVGVVDGDTVKIVKGKQVKKVRLSFIDAPEMGQPYGKTAKKALSDKVYKKQVIIKSHGQDRYGRILAELYLAGHNINRDMVSDGHAWVYRKYTDDQNYLKAEKKARKQRVGLWRLANNQRIPPWEWRKKERSRK